MRKTFAKLVAIMLIAIPSVNTAAQQVADLHPFNGVVTDLLGNPIKKVQVYLHTPDIYATSDKKGRFGFNNINDDDTIHLVYNKELYFIPVEGRHGMRIKLGDQLNVSADNDEQLADLGYGFVKRREHTKSSSGITRDELILTGKTDLLAALTAKVPGLNVSSSSIPGSQSTSQIRGKSSLYGNTEPLYLVDGVTVDNLSFINIYDVEYVEVTKDANMYGVRGANGVISVHTIKGK